MQIDDGQSSQISLVWDGMFALWNLESDMQRSFENTIFLAYDAHLFGMWNVDMRERMEWIEWMEWMAILRLRTIRLDKSYRKRQKYERVLLRLIRIGTSTPWHTLYI